MAPVVVGSREGLTQPTAAVSGSRLHPRPPLGPLPVREGRRGEGGL